MIKITSRTISNFFDISDHTVRAWFVRNDASLRSVSDVLSCITFYSLKHPEVFVKTKHAKTRENVDIEG